VAVRSGKSDQWTTVMGKILYNVISNQNPIVYDFTNTKFKILSLVRTLSWVD